MIACFLQRKLFQSSKKNQSDFAKDANKDKDKGYRTSTFPLFPFASPSIEFYPNNVILAVKDVTVVAN